MTIEEIIVTLNQINFESLSDKELSKLSEVLRAKSSDASRIAYFKSKQRSSYDPDIMAAD